MFVDGYVFSSAFTPVLTACETWVLCSDATSNRRLVVVTSIPSVASMKREDDDVPLARAVPHLRAVISCDDHKINWMAHKHLLGGRRYMFIMDLASAARAIQSAINRINDVMKMLRGFVGEGSEHAVNEPCDCEFCDWRNRTHHRC